MKRKSSFIIPLLTVSILAVTSCNLEVEPPIESGASLMTAINYNSNQRIIYSKDASYTTPDGQHTYSKGDFKPFWEDVQNELGITLKEHAAAANSGEKKSVSYFRDNWLNKPYADITMGTVNAITKYAVSGDKETILDLMPYLKRGEMPNLTNFLYTQNPGLLNSIMTSKHSNAGQAAIYFVPYCDGFDDVQRSMMVRQDYIEKLLDNDTSEFYDKDEKIIGAKGSGAKYELSIEDPFIKDDSYTIKIPNVDLENGNILDAEKQLSLTKRSVNECGGNIVAQQNEAIKNGNGNSKYLAKQFQDYIKARYYGVAGQPDVIRANKPSDLFLGWRACFDTDELIALMRLVKVSSKTIYGESDNKEMVIWFPTEWTNVCSADLYRWAGQVFGVRGTDSRTGYLYFNGLNTFKEGFDSTDKIHDCRGDVEMFNLLKTLQKLYKEGLLMQDFDSQTATGTTNNKFNEQLILDYLKDEDKPNKKYHGFMSYYTPFSESKLNEYNDTYKKSSDKRTEPGTIYAPIIGAVTKWDTNGDGTRDDYMQFTESWISAKTSALCLNADLAKNDAKRKAAFDLINYIYSPRGQANYNYGPMKYGYYYDGDFNKVTGDFELSDTGKAQKKKEKDDGLVTKERDGVVTYNGKIYPQYTFKAEEQIKTTDGVARERIGVTMPFGFVKMNGVVFQQTREKSREGVLKINKAIECGTYKHTCINDVLEEYKDLDKSFYDDLIKNPVKQPFYKIVPASFYLTDGQNTDLARILDKTKLGSIYTDDNQSQFNIWDDYVMGTKSASAPEFDKYLETVNGSWECPKLVTYYQQAYELMG